MRLHQRIRREQGRNSDDWLITYADTITLLLCLFVIVLSIKSSGKSLAHDVMTPGTQAVTSDFIFAGNPPFHAPTCGPEPAAVVASETPPQPIGGLPEPGSEPPEPAEMAPVLVASLVPVAAARPEITSVSFAAPILLPAPALLPAPVMSPAPVLLPAQVMSSGGVLSPAPVSFPAIVDRLKSQGTAVVEQQGDRITTLQIGSTAFFSSGYATLSGAGKSILADVAVMLKSSAYAAYHISIEGHTDDTPINTLQFQSNWELSTARAAAVVRFFLEQGVPAAKLSAAGYADTFPVAPNRSADGTVIPENQARNRRVVIKLEKIDKSEN